MADFLQSKYTQALRNQSKPAAAAAENLTCPYCSGRIFQTDDQLWHHARLEHLSILQGMNIDPENPGRFRNVLRQEAAQYVRIHHSTWRRTAPFGRRTLSPG
jgi:hypothetical protein